MYRCLSQVKWHKSNLLLTFLLLSLGFFFLYMTGRLCIMQYSVKPLSNEVINSTLSKSSAALKASLVEVISVRCPLFNSPPPLLSFVPPNLESLGPHSASSVCVIGYSTWVSDSHERKENRKTGPSDKPYLLYYALQRLVLQSLKTQLWTLST